MAAEQETPMKKLMWGASLALLSAAAAAQGVDRQARSWAASCAACHGTDGRSTGAIPPLAGRNADELLRALLEFKSGQRPAATVMHQHSKGYTDDELKRIAQFFANTAAK
jgi:cytochrome c553